MTRLLQCSFYQIINQTPPQKKKNHSVDFILLKMQQQMITLLVEAWTDCPFVLELLSLYC